MDFSHLLVMDIIEQRYGGFERNRKLMDEIGIPYHPGVDAFELKQFIEREMDWDPSVIFAIGLPPQINHRTFDTDVARGEAFLDAIFKMLSIEYSETLVIILFSGFKRDMIYREVVPRLHFLFVLIIHSQARQIWDHRIAQNYGGDWRSLHSSSCGLYVSEKRAFESPSFAQSSRWNRHPLNLYALQIAGIGGM